MLGNARGLLHWIAWKIGCKLAVMSHTGLMIRVDVRQPFAASHLDASQEGEAARRGGAPSTRAEAKEIAIGRHGNESSSALASGSFWEEEQEGAEYLLA